MKIIDGIENLKEALPYPVLTIGNFDGVHLGHQSIFRMVIEAASEHNGTSIVFTFVPHPLSVIAPERAPQLLTTYKEKIQLINSFGIDVIICANFTKEFANVTAEEFVSDVLHKTLNVREVYVGSNYSFGKGRKGSPEFLRELGSKYGFTVHIVDEVMVNNVIPSSSRIRNLIARGKVNEASILLGRPYAVEGIVIEGAKRGKSILHVPTANLLTANEVLPKDGVYAAVVEIDGRKYGGATNIGYNPTFEDKKFSFETHVLGFAGELLGKTIKVHFLERIRDEMKFRTAEDLAAQIKKDIVDIKEILKRHGL